MIFLILTNISVICQRILFVDKIFLSCKILQCRKDYIFAPPFFNGKKEKKIFILDSTISF
jgi:hypothetical protein